MFSISLILLLF